MLEVIGPIEVKWDSKSFSYLLNDKKINDILDNLEKFDFYYLDKEKEKINTDEVFHRLKLVVSNINIPKGVSDAEEFDKMNRLQVKTLRKARDVVELVINEKNKQELKAKILDLKNTAKRNIKKLKLKEYPNIKPWSGKTDEQKLIEKIDKI